MLTLRDNLVNDKFVKELLHVICPNLLEVCAWTDPDFSSLGIFDVLMCWNQYLLEADESQKERNKEINSVKIKRPCFALA